MLTMIRLSPRLKSRLIEEYCVLAHRMRFIERLNNGEVIPCEDAAMKRLKKIEAKLNEYGVKGKTDLKWEYAPGGEAEYHCMGEVRIHVIPPDIFLVGRVGRATLSKTLISNASHEQGFTVGLPSRGSGEASED
jgi:hypothetical protein